VATRGTVYVVFFIPVILSLVFGSLVMAEVLKEPGRELNMWQFDASKKHLVSSDVIKIINLQNQYSVSTPVNIQVTVSDRVFDCGDLYLTIKEQNSGKVITQSGFFGQCFDRNNSILPVDDEFSEAIDKTGNYELVIEMIDKHHQQTVSRSALFSVK
jgi:hypothetical protein